MIRGALKNPYLVLIGVLTVLLVGTIAILRIPSDILPVFQTPAVQILTLYPGMPAEVMEKDITSRIERWTGQSNGISRQESRSMTGVSVVRDYFRPGIDANTAMSQVASLATSDLYYLPPGTIPPMVMPFDPTASLPLALLSVSSPSLDETKLYDIAYFELRNRLQGISGVIAPAVYGGRIRRILAYVDREKLFSRGLSPMDVVQALKNSNTLIPTGNAKIGDFDYQITTDGLVPKVDDMNAFPVKLEPNGTPISIGDVGKVEDTHQIQTNIVHVDGKRQVYIPIYRQPGANTISVVDGVNRSIAGILARLPKDVKLDVILDQSIYVRKAIHSLEFEVFLGTLLAGLVLLLFMGTLRSTFAILLAIPLSLITAIAGLFFTHNSLNLMTLGGLALVVGRLVDDSVVVLENTNRHLKMGKPPEVAALDAAEEVRMPVLVSTMVTIIVFAPVVLIEGIGKFLFTPLALTVTLAMTASYVIALTVIPVYCARFLLTSGTRKPYRWFAAFERGYERTRMGYERLVNRVLSLGRFVLAGTVLVLAGSFLLYPYLGKELFPQVDSGQFNIQMRAASGTRIERTEQLVTQVEQAIRKSIGPADLQMLISNIGVLYDWPAAYTPNAGPMDASLMVQLREKHRTTSAVHVDQLRRELGRQFPFIDFSFETGGLIRAAITSGLPSPLDIQIGGNNLAQAQNIAQDLVTMLSGIPGIVDPRIKQRLDYPQIDLRMDREKSAMLGINALEAVQNVVTGLNSSINFNPQFWIDPKNSNHYFLGAQYQEQDVRNLDALLDTPITGAAQQKARVSMANLYRPTPRYAADQDAIQPVLLRNIASMTRSFSPTEINHLDISRVMDVYADVDGRDIASVAADVNKRLSGKKWPTGYTVSMRGEVSAMSDSFRSLGYGFSLAVLLIYFVMVPQFRSMVDPVIVMLAFPLGLIGVLWMLFLTGTTLNIESFMGTIFMIGIAHSNSTLIVEFADKLRAEGRNARTAIVEAVGIRLRPILMTAAAAIIALMPAAFNSGDPSSSLARAVIGGLTSSTVLILLVLPPLYLEFKK